MVSRPLALASTLAFALLLVAPLCGAQLPATPLDPILKPALDEVAVTRDRALGPELTREDVDVRLDMTFRDVDFDTVNVIFGGGKFSATARIEARIDMRVIAATRIREALDGAAPGASNLTALGLDTSSSYIPADAFRASFAGEALRAFQDEQEERLAAYIRATIPNVTVMNTDFAWANVSPQDSYENSGSLPPIPRGTPTPDPNPRDVNDPTFPPLTLAAVVDVEYLERTNLLDIIEKALEPETDREKERKEHVADAAASYERSAFGLLGIRQVLDLQAPRGWNLEVHVTLPDGFTFEEASPDVALGKDLRRAEVVTLGKDASGSVVNPVALTLSNRFLVSTAMLAGVLLVGTILRFPVLLAANAIRRRLRS